MKVITLQVKDDTAQLVEQMSEANKANLSKLIDLWVVKPTSIIEVMEEMGEYAAKQGLTQEKLDDLLKNE
jgi:hypothetical protein